MAKKPQKTKELTRLDYIFGALSVAGHIPWNMVTLTDIANETSGTLAQMREYFDDKNDILGAYGAYIDREMLEEVKHLDEALSLKDKLFELMMVRFDTIENHRDGVLSIVRSIKTDPKSALYSLPHLCRSMGWILEGAGESAEGVKGALKIAGLTGVYMNTLRAWVEEESPDMSATMAALDKGLTQAGTWSERFNL